MKTVIGRSRKSCSTTAFHRRADPGRHGEPTKHITAVMEHAINSLAPKLTPEQQAEEDAIQDRGTFDPRVIAEGTIPYLITFDDGFRIVYRDSGGHVTDYEKAAFANRPRRSRAGRAVGRFSRAPGDEQALEHEKLYKPDVFMPAHHDAAYSGHTPLWRATEPVFQALKDDDPHLTTVSRGYREPVCFDTEYAEEAVSGTRRALSLFRRRRRRGPRSPCRRCSSIARELFSAWPRAG